VVIAGEGSSLPVGAIVGGRVEESFSDYAIADERDLVVIPEGIDPYATLPEPMGCVVEAVRRTPINPGARVAVIGLGFMGLLMVQLLRNAGTSQIVGVDPRADARKVALLNGADGTLDGAELPRDFYSGEGTPARFGFDVVVEASGSQGGLDLATQLAKSHGVLSILGYHQQERRVDMRMWNWKALDVVNGHVRDRDLLRKSTAAALDLQASGRIDPGSLITHRYPLSDVDTAYQAMATKPDGFIKALIEMPQ
jgi:threonine dehydrogenase-like Zn-dependent dehydrogenase